MVINKRFTMEMFAFSLFLTQNLSKYWLRRKLLSVKLVYRQRSSVSFLRRAVALIGGLTRALCDPVFTLSRDSAAFLPLAGEINNPFYSCLPDHDFSHSLCNPSTFCFVLPPPFLLSSRPQTSLDLFMSGCIGCLSDSYTVVSF